MRFDRKERVAVVTPHHGAPPRRRDGVVLDEGRNGIHVRLDDTGASQWFVSKYVRRILPDGRLAVAPHRKRPAEGEGEEVAETPAETPAEPSADPATEMLRSLGVALDDLDPLTVWTRLGAAIADRLRDEVRAAASARIAAETDAEAAGDLAVVAETEHERAAFALEAARRAFVAAEQTLAAADRDLAAAKALHAAAADTAAKARARESAARSRLATVEGT